MDCCNYMQFRHPYYDPQIFENGLYTRDYYGHPYQSYYTNPYYSQQWPCATPFTDYVYNPKEARIRKAMRESSRERTLGAGRTPSPRGRRQSQTWSSIPEEQLMMAPSPDLGPPICSSPIFHSSTPPLSQFLPPINNYSKLVHVLPPAGWLHDTPTYLQHNPMAELQQHQANMWQQYQDPLRSCTGPAYMMDSPFNLYQGIDSTEPPILKKCPDLDSYPPTNRTPENVPASPGDEHHQVKSEDTEQNLRSVVESPTPEECDKQLKESEPYLPSFQETVVIQNPFDKEDDVKLNKQPVQGLKRQRNKNINKALPDFNEAFGSTERGRFQCVPDPRLPTKKSYLDFFFTDDTVRYCDFEG